jgi:hypothetical protein
MNDVKHSGPATFPVRAHVADGIVDACERLGIFASRLIELLIERHAYEIEPADAQRYQCEKEAEQRALQAAEAKPSRQLRQVPRSGRADP